MYLNYINNLIIGKRSATDRKSYVPIEAAKSMYIKFGKQIQ
jgi:hypothetical protein